MNQTGEPRANRPVGTKESDSSFNISGRCAADNKLWKQQKEFGIQSIEKQRFQETNQMKHNEFNQWSSVEFQNQERNPSKKEERSKLKL